jgi:hypothetical protein
MTDGIIQKSKSNMKSELLTIGYSPNTHQELFFIIDNSYEELIAEIGKELGIMYDNSDHDKNQFIIKSVILDILGKLIGDNKE